MITINNCESLIEKVGGIEKAKGIIEGAPESNFPVKWGLSFKTYFRQVGYSVEQWFEGRWQTRYSDSNWVDLETLRTAIVQYDQTSVLLTTDQEFKVGNRVYVDFLSANKTEFSGNKIEGEGVIDRVEGGYIFGRLDCGQTFMCPEADVVVINDDAENEFKKWIKASQEYQTLVFRHGERLFICRDGQYDILSIRLARRLWAMIEGHQFTFNVMAKSLAEAKNRFDAASNLATQWRDLKIKGIAPEHRAYEDALNKCADELEKALRGERE